MSKNVPGFEWTYVVVTRQQVKVIPGLDTFAHIWRAELNGIVKEPNDNARVTK